MMRLAHDQNCPHQACVATNFNQPGYGSAIPRNHNLFAGFDPRDDPGKLRFSFMYGSTSPM
jgi:hypothetical protein